VGARAAAHRQATRVRTLVIREMHQIMKDIDVMVSPTNRRASCSSATTLVIHA